jgi:uncharacterized membrane protein (DUF441 family)
MTLLLQTPPSHTLPSAPTESSVSLSAPQTSVGQPAFKSIFASKTFWGIVFTAVAAIAPIVGEKIDSPEGFQAKDAAQIVVILCGAASAIIGRVDAGSVYTPKFLPGPNKPE